MTRTSSLNRLLDNLAAGEPLAWGLVGLLAVAGVAFGLFVAKVHLDFRREDQETRAKRSGRGQWPR